MSSRSSGRTRRPTTTVAVTTTRRSPASPRARGGSWPPTTLGSSRSSRGAKIATRRSLAPQARSWMPTRRATSLRAALFTPCSRSSPAAPMPPGRPTWATAPRTSTLCPSSLSTRMRPRCISTRRRVIARPSPVPRLRTRSSFVCLYSSKMTARSCGLMPGPVSRTLMRAMRPSRPTSTTTSPCCVNLIALPTRFVSTCRTRFASARA